MGLYISRSIARATAQPNSQITNNIAHTSHEPDHKATQDGQKQQQITNEQKHMEDMPDADNNSQIIKSVLQVIIQNYDISQLSLNLSTQVNTWKYILGARSWSEIRSLDLSFCMIRGIHVKVIMDNRWNNLRTLMLMKNNLGSTGVKFLVKTQMNNIQKIYLNKCQIGDEGCKYLVKGYWPQLQYLNIGNNCIQFNGLLSMNQNNWRQLWKIQGSQSGQNPISIMHLAIHNYSELRLKLKIKNRKFKADIRKFIMVTDEDDMRRDYY